MKCQKFLLLLTAVVAMLAVATTASATDGTWTGVDGAEMPRLWSDTANWDLGVIADGAGAVATVGNNNGPTGGGDNNGVIEIDSNRTLGEYITSSYREGFLTTADGVTLTWDSGDPNTNAVYSSTGNFISHKDERDMVLVSDLEYVLKKQRGNTGGGEGIYSSGVISGDGKLILDIRTQNGDGATNLRYNIMGDSPNTYTGGTEIAIYGDNMYGAQIVGDGCTLQLHKDGALGTGDVTMTHIEGNLQVLSSGGDEDRISDTATLSLASGYDPDIHLAHVKGYMHNNVILDTDVTETINELYLNGFQAPAGTYNATTSPIWFQGEGSMTVTNGGPAATTQTSAAAGNWNAGATWGGTAPTYFDESAVGHAVTVAADAAANNVALTAGGSVTINAGTTLLVQNSVDPSGGTVTVNGTLDTLHMPSTTGLTLGAGSTLTVGKTMVVDSNFDTSAAATVQLPGCYEGDTLRITNAGVLTLATDLKHTRNVQVSGTLNINGNVLMQYGGKLSGNGTVQLAPDKKVEMGNQGHWQITAFATGGAVLAPGEGVGTLTVQDGEFQLQGGRSDNNTFRRNHYEWEIGQGETDVLSVVNGHLNLDFSFQDPTNANNMVFDIIDADGYVASATDKLDLFTYDAASTINVNEDGAGLVQSLDADCFNVQSLIDAGTWTIGTIEVYHEAYGGGGGHVYLTGISGGTLASPALAWDGGIGNWADAMWDGAAPTADQDMVINADTDDSVVTVAADFITGGTGPAKSVFVGEEYAGKLVVASGNTLEVTGETAAGEFGKIAIENGATLQTGTAVIEIDGRLIAGVQGSDKGLLDSAGQLTIEDADAIQVDWMPGTDAGSMFGGTYTIAQYSGTALATTGTTANEDANIGAAYIKSVDYAADLGGGVLGVNVELHAQGLGDTDLDGDVDGDDLATFGLAWAPSGTDKTWFDGDFDFDGDIDGDDLAALGLAWAPSGIDFPAGDLQVTAVPEPGTIVMLLIGMAGLSIYRKRR